MRYRMHTDNSRPPAEVVTLPDDFAAVFVLCRIAVVCHCVGGLI